MKKMTRFLALVTVLVLMLSMSVTAFAASIHSAAPGTCKEVRYKEPVFYCYHSNGNHYHLEEGDVIKAGAKFLAHESFGHANFILDGRQVDGDVSYPDNDFRVTRITADTLEGGAILPQPKTGVMDSLPLWFGVMAVSACAYVLTSKKKVF